MPEQKDVTWPLVTIGVPVYNGEKTLREALESLARQNYPNIDLLISDNGSTDNTLTICEEYAELYPFIRIHRFSKNMGAGENQMQVVRMARGEYFMLGASDDYWDPMFISENLAEIQKTPNSAVSMCNVRRIREDGTKFDEIRLDGKSSLVGKGAYSVAISLILGGNRKNTKIKNNLYIYGLFRTELIQHAILNLGFDHSFGHEPSRNERDPLSRVALMGNFCHTNKTLLTRTISDVTFTNSLGEKNIRAGYWYILVMSLAIFRDIKLPYSRRLLSVPIALTLFLNYLNNNSTKLFYRIASNILPKKTIKHIKKIQNFLLKLDFK